MNQTTITGASDDLIELDGQIHEEFSGGDDEGELLAFSDGTLLEIIYGKGGIWRITQLVAGTCEYSHVAGSEEEDTFDVATLTGELRWVVKSTREQSSIVKRR